MGYSIGTKSVTAKTMCPEGFICRAATQTQLADLLLQSHLAMEPLTHEEGLSW